MAHLTEEMKAIQMLRAPDAMGVIVAQPRDGDKFTLRRRDLELYGVTKGARKIAIREWRKRQARADKALG